MYPVIIQWRDQLSGGKILEKWVLMLLWVPDYCLEADITPAHSGSVGL